MNYVLLTDGASDISLDLAKQINVHVIDMNYTIDGETYNQFTNTLDQTEFYNKIRKGSMPSTTQINPADFEDIFEVYLKEGKSVIYMSLSSALSGTYNSAVMAGEELEEKYPELKVKVVDTKCASYGEGFFAYLVAKEANSGKSFDEVCEFAENLPQRVALYFTVDSLAHLQRGGRVSKVSAVVGTALGIKPCLFVNEKGELKAIDKVRGRKPSLDYLVKKMKDKFVGDKNSTVFISHGDCLADAEYVRDQIKKEFGITDFQIDFIGPVIGTHSGPGTVALFFESKER